MEIRRANKQEANKALEILKIGRRKMVEAGNHNQWDENYPSLLDVKRDIEEGSLYLVMEKEEILGVFTLLEGEDPSYKKIYGGSWLNEKDYLTLHRIASTGRKKKVLTYILAWTKEKTDNIRIDTHEDNTIMKHILEKNNFLECGLIRVADGSERIAYHWSKN